MNRFTSLLAVLALLAFAGPVAAQEETPPAAEETPDTVAPETPDAMAPETPDTPDTTEVASTHDWEFSLQPNETAQDATAVVMVTEGDPENTFVVEVTGLPPVDELDTPERDVNAYTVWIAPSKEKVRESTLAGSLTVDAEGSAKFEGSTALDAFGVLILATENGAPTELVGTPVLTGIPAPEAAAEPSVAPEPGVEPEPGVAPEPGMEPGVEPEPEPAVEPEPEVAPEPDVAPEPETYPEPGAEPQPETPQG
ncbi:MAG TPA: hypothetical protein VG799_03075 [Gemmatimonadota bacterium]|jgi:hypothetical protein|nr:hypothetical protein [Gemmatimonadota bacterium]